MSSKPSPKRKAKTDPKEIRAKPQQPQSDSFFGTVDQLCDALHKNSDIKTVHILKDRRDEFFTDRDAETLLGLMIDDQYHITSLDLSDLGGFKGQCCEMIACIIKKNTTITSLDLSNNFFWFGSELDFEDLANALKENTTLVSLDLGGCGIDAANAQLLVCVLAENTTLAELTLGCSNRITHAVYDAIASLLKKNKVIAEKNRVIAEKDSTIAQAEQIAALVKQNIKEILTISRDKHVAIRALMGNE